MSLMQISTTRWLVTLILLSVSTVAHTDEAAEAAFVAAAGYTVKLTVTSEFGFIESEPGSWRGAGFLVDRQRGWILTNAHVAGYVPALIEAQFRGGKNIAAKALFVDNLQDIAVLEIPSAAIPAEVGEAPLACDGLPGVGADLGTFGHPLGYAFTATRGIMAGVSRSNGYPMIQTDAPISPGNSGGPLIDLATGKVIGINTASLGDRRSQNMNFAVMMPHACRVLELLRAGRSATVPRIATAFAVDESDIETLIVADAPATPDGFGLQRGDEILGLAGSDDRYLAVSDLLIDLRGRYGKTPLRVQRGDRELLVEANLMPSIQYLDRRGLRISGVVFAPRLMYEVSSTDEAGVLLVHHIEPGSQGELRSIEYGQEVVSVNGKALSSLSQLAQIAEQAQKAGQGLRLILRRMVEDDYVSASYQVRDLPVDDIAWHPR